MNEEEAAEISTGNSASEYREMDERGNIGPGNIGDNETNNLKRKWLKAGAILRMPLNILTENVVTPLVNHERARNLDTGIADRMEPITKSFTKMGDTIKPYSDSLIEDGGAAMGAIGRGISYTGRRFSDAVLLAVNPDYKPATGERSSESVTDMARRTSTSDMDATNSLKTGFLSGKMNEGANPVWKPSGSSNLKAEVTSSSPSDSSSLKAEVTPSSPVVGVADDSEEGDGTTEKEAA